MKKLEFLSLLRSRLAGLPTEEVEERLCFYTEMIDDGIEEGLCEEDAVARIGSVDEIAEQILSEIPLSKPGKGNKKSKRKVWQTVLLAVGSPLWLSLMIAALAVIIALYAVLLAVMVCLWALFASVAACTLGGIAASIAFALQGDGLTGCAMIGAAITCAGVSIFLFYGCKAATKGTIWLTGKTALGIKRCFIKKEDT